MKIVFRWLVVAVVCAGVIGGWWLAQPPTSQAQGGAAWTVSVFSNPDLAGSPLPFAAVTNSVNFSWGTGVPVINGVPVPGAPNDNFSVRFVTTTFFTAGNYRFTVQVDDGARLYVDGVLLINAWQAGLGLRTLQADYNFTVDGNHTITVEMFDTIDNATIIASWALSAGGGLCVTGYTYSACPAGSVPGSNPAPSGWPPASGPSAICNDGWNSCSTNASGTCSDHGGVRYWCIGTTGGQPGQAWSGEFFNGVDLAGPPIYTTTYPASGLNLNWGQGSPGGAVPADNFSARFMRTINVPSELAEGVYTFYARADDGFRFYVDNTLIFDQWDAFVNQTFTAPVTLLNGPHVLKFEYREFTMDALVFLTWSPPSAQNPVINPDASGAPVQATATPAPGQPDGQGGQAAPPPPAVGVRGMVMGNLRVRSGPSLRDPKIGLMPWGTEVDILGRDSGHAWYQVNFNGLVGWAYAPWIRLLTGSFDALPYTDGTRPVFAPPPTQGVIAQAFGNMRIRSGPGFQYPKISKAQWGTRVQVLARSTNGLWIKVQHGDVVGWTYLNWYRIVQGDLGAVPVTDQ